MKKLLIIGLIFVVATGFSASAVKVAVIDSTYLGHGTTICNIIKQQAPGAEVELYKASETPYINAAKAAEMIKKAVNEGADIINLSFGGPDPSGTLARAINDAISQGVVVVAAAGNDGGATPNFPAAFPGVISVGALDSMGNIAPYSNRGADVFAPGTAYNGMQGTSFAAPYIAGQIARKMTEDNLSATQAAEAVVGPGYGQRVVSGPIPGGIRVVIQDPETFIPPEQVLPDEEIWYELLALIYIMDKIVNQVFADVVSQTSVLGADWEPVYSGPIIGDYSYYYRPVIPSLPEFIGF